MKLSLLTKTSKIVTLIVFFKGSILVDVKQFLGLYKRG